MAKEHISLRGILKKAQKDFVRYNLLARKRKLLANIGELVYSMYRAGSLKDIPEDMLELLKKVDRLEERLAELDE